jgi:cytochrome P450
MSGFPPVPVYLARDGFKPVEELGRLRAEAPVSKVEIAPWGTPMPAWLVTRYHDVREVLRDTARFSNLPRLPGGSRDERLLMVATPGIFNNFDPPEHTRLRKLVTPEFTVKRLRRLHPRIESIVADCLDRMAAAGPPVDLVQEFAIPLPSLVACELLGVPHDLGLEFLRRGGLNVDREMTMEEREADLKAARAIMGELVAQQRQEPGDGVLGMLVRDHSDELDDEELIGLGSLLMLTGIQGMASMLALGVVLLLEHPEQLAMVRDKPAAVPAAIEELLRYLSVVQVPIPRWTTEDVVIAGQEIKAGEMVVCSFLAANYDEVLGSGLDGFDIRRKPVAHVAWGYGVHHCLGAPLAKMELEIAFPALLRRFPSLRLDVPIEQISFRTNTPKFDVDSVPVAW